MKNKGFLALVAFALIPILLSSGCGGGISLPFLSAEQDAPADGGDSIIVDNGPFSSPDQLTENWINFRAFVRLIKDAEWEYDDGDLRVIYSYEGQENVSGTSADRVTVNNILADGREESWTIWVNENGDIVQAVWGDEFLSEEQFEGLKMLSVLPLASFANEEWDPDFYREFKQTLAGKQVSGWELVSWSSTRSRIGGKPVDIYRVELIHYEGFGPEVAVFEYGDFGPFRMMLNLDHITVFNTKSLTFR